MIPMVKFCECGCGLEAPIAHQSDTKRGYVKGEPRRFRKGHHGRGHTRSAETIQKMREAQRGERHPRWKGDAAGYSAIHIWVRSNYVKQGSCVDCDKKGLTEWANLSGNYTRERKDWIELCRSCHRKRDNGVHNLGT